MHLPDRPPFALRGRVLTPLAAGGVADHPDGVVEIGADGRISWVGDAPAWVAQQTGTGSSGGAGAPIEPIDLRPLVLLPGMVDLHAHLPQLPNAGLGAGLDLLTWLDRYIFPLERRWEDPEVARRLTASAFEAFAAAGTTTVLAYGAVYRASMDAAFEAAEAHGIRA